MRIPWFQPRAKIYTALDIGSSKVRMTVVDDKMKQLASAEVASVGMLHGELADAHLMRFCIKDVWQQCEKQSKLRISSVYLAVTGAHFMGQNHTASYRLPDEVYRIAPEHLEMARKKARGLDLGEERFLVNDWCGRFYIDKRETTRYPVDLSGRTLELTCHLISAEKKRLQGVLQCLRDLSLELSDIVFSPFASAQALLSSTQKEAGAILIDMGFGTTEYICYHAGDVVASGCIPQGSDQINQAIMRAYHKTVNSQAVEYLKCHEGDAYGDMNDTSLATYIDGEYGLHSLSMERGILNKVMCHHMTDILGRVRERLADKALLKGGMHVYLTGGGSLTQGIEGLAHQIFGLPVTVPQDAELKAGQTYEREATHSTVRGLIRYAYLCDKDLL